MFRRFRGAFSYLVSFMVYTYLVFYISMCFSLHGIGQQFSRLILNFLKMAPSEAPKHVGAN
jgi:hypothetical protein